MAILINLGHLKEYFHTVRQFLPQKLTLSTTQKVVVVSVTTTVVVFGALSRYLRRKKKVIDPSKLRDSSQIRRTVLSASNTKRSRASGVKSPNGDVGSVASSGRRSGTYSDKYIRQGSVISGKASIASGSIISSGLPIPEGLETANLTPQQLGVMGK